MSLTWQTPQLDYQTRLLTLRTEDGSVALSFEVALEAEGTMLGLAGAMIEGPAEFGAAEEIVLPLHYHTPPLTCTLHLSLVDEGRTVLLSAQLHNPGPDPVRLGKCCLVSVSEERGEVSLAGDDGGAVYLQVSGTTGPTGVRRAAAEEAGFSRTLLQFVSPAAGRTLHLGFATFDRQDTRHDFAYGEAGFTSLQSSCDFQDHVLGPGEQIATETLMIEASADSHESLHRWADRAAARYQPAQWPKIPAGWLGWSWVDAFNVENYEETVLRNCRAIRRRLAGFDIEYVWVSIGNIEDGLPGKWLQWNYESFPHGPQYAVGELDKLGFKLGLWCGAFWLASSVEDKVRELQEGILKLNGELAISRAEWQYGSAGRLPREQRPCIYSLDPTHPKSRDFIANVFATYREWGIRYYMVDFLCAIAWPNEGTEYDEHYDPSVVRGPQMLREGLKIVREAAGPETYLLSSSGPTIQNTGLMDACRVGNDYGEGRALNPESYFYPATFVINAASFWTSHKYASSNTAGYYFTHRKLYLNDGANVLTLDKPVPLCEAQIVATIFGFCGGPVMLGDDIDRISEERLALIKKVFPRTPQVGQPLDLFTRPHPDYPRTFHNHVVTDWGEWEIVSVLNYDDQPLQAEVSFESLGVDPAQPCLLWEFWNEQYLGIHTGAFEVMVPPRSARVYRLAKQRRHPWIASTDMHVQQGQVELSGVVWDREALTLSGQVTRPAGNTGNVFLIAPRGLAVVNPQGYHIAKDATENCLIISRQFDFAGEPETFSIVFKVIDEKYAMEELDLT